ncbi:DUF2971 domain-containing protein [Echinicola sp. 20G]|uniref:DUF2971 domain-containing protein n=1 Tax=Echinicola sp. 20G TaxID=2781961 RepID=UPI0019108624|nr:DUF2971 domain-containing protein [Echinicola sp. 20G]
MELGEVRELSFDEWPDIPDTIYKYRIWNDKYQKTILTERIVFMAPPTSFEDKRDCKLLKRYDLMTEKDIYEKYFMVSKKEHPNWTRQQHRKFARDWTKNSPLKNHDFVKKQQEEDFLEYDKRFGVLSLTANFANLDMWNKYSGNGSGFCAGFDPKILFNHLGGGGPVQYYDKLPDILHNDKFEVERFKQVFSKERKWEFEQEYRTHKFYPAPATIDDRQIEIPTEAYKEVIFGWNTDEETKGQIMGVCENQNLQVEFKICSMTNGQLEIKSLTNN